MYVHFDYEGENITLVNRGKKPGSVFSARENVAAGGLHCRANFHAALFRRALLDEHKNKYERSDKSYRGFNNKDARRYVAFA